MLRNDCEYFLIDATEGGRNGRSGRRRAKASNSNGIRYAGLNETRIRRTPILLHQRLAERPRLDRVVGEQAGLLSPLRQCEDFCLPQQQSARGFLLHRVQRGIRAKEPERQIRREGFGRRVQD